jgi:hypothetical protein
MLLSSSNLNLDFCKIPFEFIFDKELEGTYPYLNPDTGTPFAIFAMYNLSNTTFQTTPISMTLDSVEYNRFSKSQSDENIEYCEALESRIKSIYTSSWIYKYFSCRVISDDGVVMFIQSQKKDIFSSIRFKIYVYISESTKQFFFPLNEWQSICETSDCYVLTDLISNIQHGFRTMCFPSTKSVYYKPPYFIIFKSPSIPKNYLTFKDFLKPNFDDTILAMIQYDEEKEKFVPYFTPTITLPFLKTLTLSKTLEFIIVDSNKKQVVINDFSQLFISIIFRS